MFQDKEGRSADLIYAELPTVPVVVVPGGFHEVELYFRDKWGWYHADYDPEFDQYLPYGGPEGLRLQVIKPGIIRRAGWIIELPSYNIANVSKRREHVWCQRRRQRVPDTCRS